MTSPPARGPGLPRVEGHDELLARVREAARGHRMPQSLLLHGPEGVGKRTVALWIAAMLHCEADEAPCGACRGCRLAARLEHPDIHYHFPMRRPKKSGSRRKLREALETQRQERIAELREDPAAPPEEEGVTGIYLGAVENIRAQAARRPAMGRIAVFIVAEADRMVSQSASPEAANAFLKLLEEPPDFAYLILTTARPSALLPTIRSRTAHLRLAPLPEAAIAAFLAERGYLEPERARSIARRADGSIGRALSLAGRDDDEAGQTADRLLAAALRGDAALRYRVAGDFSASGARSVLAPALERLEERLRDLLCVSAGSPALARDPEAVAAIAEDRVPQEDRVLEAFDAVHAALDGASRNLNPQATVSVLMRDLDRAFTAG